MALKMPQSDARNLWHKISIFKFSHLFNLNAAAVTAAVTSVRSNRKQMESGSMYIDYMPKQRSATCSC